MRNLLLVVVPVNPIIWTAASFLAGSIPFSVVLGKLFSAGDIRSVGDGNPGAANAWKAGGARVGVPALLLDFLKGALPVGLALHYGAAGYALAAVALAPVAGHAFSPFLRFRGGKAVAVTVGVWTGLTLWEGPVFLGFLFVLLYLFQENDAWSVIIALAALLGLLLYRWFVPEMLLIWAGNISIVTFKHFADLTRPPRLKKMEILRKR
jgi:acyl phosphate:glycerol-3-phosphate acyltransferase